MRRALGFTVALAVAVPAIAQLGPSRQVCPAGDRRVECIVQTNRDSAAAAQREMDERNWEAQRKIDARQSQDRDARRRECLRKLGPYDSAINCPR